jgi:NH3-dependent NAD+ synthetase
MKTAIQQLIEKLKVQQKILEKEDSIVLAAALYAGQRMAEELLEKEKEQIINSYRKGRYNESPFIDSNEAEEYYNQTYNKIEQINILAK